jgi:hypothetical protein
MTITWSNIESQSAPNAADHLARLQGLGLECPLDVFEQSSMTTEATRPSPASCDSSIGAPSNGKKWTCRASRFVGW